MWQLPQPRLPSAQAPIAAVTDWQDMNADSQAPARWQERQAGSETLDDILPEAFAVVREAAKRVLGMQHYAVQLVSNTGNDGSIDHSC